jgi:hypothetical protein
MIRAAIAALVIFGAVPAPASADEIARLSLANAAAVAADCITTNALQRWQAPDGYHTDTSERNPIWRATGADRSPLLCALTQVLTVPLYDRFVLHGNRVAILLGIGGEAFLAEDNARRLRGMTTYVRLEIK